jgi:hypothetical protein
MFFKKGPERKTIVVFVLTFMITMGYSGMTRAEDIQGQRPMMFIGEAFQFIPGTWSQYMIHDRLKNEHYQMVMAILEKTKVDGKPCSWMEIEITSLKNPPVITRMLVEETKSGPGDIKEVIVQIKGYAPFTVPQKYFEGSDKEVGQFKPAFVKKRINQRRVTLNNREMVAWEAEAVDDKGKTTRALVSESVLPIGVIMAENEEMRMYLSQSGGNAKTRIEGSPMNFYLWLLMQVGQGVGKP